MNYSMSIWDSLKYEILNVQEKDVEEEAINVLQAIAAKLSQGLTSMRQTTPLAQYLRPILKECSELLQEPQQKKAKPASQIVYSISKSSTVTLFFVVSEIFPSSLATYEKSETILKRTALLEVFAGVADAAYLIEGNSEGSEVSSELRNPIGRFKDRLFELASSALMGGSVQETSFRVAAVKLLFRLSFLRYFLKESEIGAIIKYLCELVLSEDQDGRNDLKKEAIQAINGISKVRPNLVKDISIPEFISRLPDSQTDRNDYLVVLEAIAQLSAEQSIAHTLARRLLNKLELVLKQGSSSAYPRAILSTLFHILDRQNALQLTDMDVFYEKVVISFVRQAALASVDRTPITALNEESTMERLGRLANLIVRNIDVEKQKYVGSQIYSLFANENRLKPFSLGPDSPVEQRKTLVLSAWLMAGVQTTVSSSPNPSPKRNM